MSANPHYHKDQRGIIVQFDNEESVHQAVPLQMYLSNNARMTSEVLNVWFTELTLYELVPYWKEHFQVDQWQFYVADYLSATQWQIINAMTWTQLLEIRPKFWIDDIIRAKRIRMMYQPIVEWKQKSLHLLGHEMLARGYVNSEQIIPPEQLFEAAKDNGRLYQLDRLCRMEALRAGHLCPDDSKIFINFVPSSIYSPKRCLQSTFSEAKLLNLDPARIVFEVIETEQIDDLPQMLTILDHYHEQGYSYALDDVGKGMNTIKRLHQLQPDIVKLDRHYVTHIDNYPIKQESAKRIAEAADQIGATCIAEGVERMEEAQYLLEVGYHIQQGYLYGRPAFSPLTAEQLTHPAQSKQL